MANYPGAFIVIEGSDGSGKATQFKLLTDRLRAVGHKVETFDFPRYDLPSSHFVKSYLNGDYGPASQISPYSASLFYALDRFEASPQIRKALKDGKVVVCNRYVGSNMAHQGSKFTNEAEQRGFFIWADSLEYQLLGIPRPDINLFLRLPAAVSQQLMVERANQTGTKLDEHEADTNHLEKAVETYDTLCKLFPQDFKPIECAPNGQLLSVAQINDMLWETIKTVVPEIKKPQEPEQPKAAVAPAQPAPPQKSSQYLSFLAVTDLAKATVRPKLSKMVKFDGSPNSYFMPGLNAQNAKLYTGYMSKLAELRRNLRKIMSEKNVPNIDETLGLLLPMAALAAVEVAPDNLTTAASQSKLPELRELAKLPANTNQPTPDKPKWQKLVDEGLSGNLSTEMEPVTLLEAWPRNEFDLLSDSLYDLSDLPRQQVQTSLESWSYEQKYQALTEILDSDGRAISPVRYRWDVVFDQGLLVEIAFNGLATNLRAQTATPRYGYSVPQNIEDTGLEGEYLDSFDLALDTYSRLQASEDARFAPYVTLGGHRIRFQLSCDLNSLAKEPEYSSQLFKDFKKQLVESVAQSHPVIAEWLQKRSQKPAGTIKSKKSGRNRGRRKRAN